MERRFVTAVKKSSGDRLNKEMACVTEEYTKGLEYPKSSVQNDKWRYGFDMDTVLSLLKKQPERSKVRQHEAVVSADQKQLNQQLLQAAIQFNRQSVDQNAQKMKQSKCSLPPIPPVQQKGNTYVGKKQAQTAVYNMRMEDIAQKKKHTDQEKQKASQMEEECRRANADMEARQDKWKRQKQEEFQKIQTRNENLAERQRKANAWRQIIVRREEQERAKRIIAEQKFNLQQEEEKKSRNAAIVKDIMAHRATQVQHREQQKKAQQQEGLALLQKRQEEERLWIEAEKQKDEQKRQMAVHCYQINTDILKERHEKAENQKWKEQKAKEKEPKEAPDDWLYLFTKTDAILVPRRGLTPEGRNIKEQQNVGFCKTAEDSCKSPSWSRSEEQTPVIRSKDGPDSLLKDTPNTSQPTLQSSRAPVVPVKATEPAYTVVLKNTPEITKEKLILPPIVPKAAPAFIQAPSSKLKPEKYRLPLRLPHAVPSPAVSNNQSLKFPLIKQSLTPNDMGMVYKQPRPPPIRRANPPSKRVSKYTTNSPILPVTITILPPNDPLNALKVTPLRPSVRH